MTIKEKFLQLMRNSGVNIITQNSTKPWEPYKKSTHYNIYNKNINIAGVYTYQNKFVLNIYFNAVNNRLCIESKSEEQLYMILLYMVCAFSYLDIQKDNNRITMNTDDVIISLRPLETKAQQYVDLIMETKEKEEGKIDEWLQEVKQDIIKQQFSDETKFMIWETIKYQTYTEEPMPDILFSNISRRIENTETMSEQEIENEENTDKKNFLCYILEMIARKLKSFF